MSGVLESDLGPENRRKRMLTVLRPSNESLDALAKVFLIRIAEPFKRIKREWKFIASGANLSLTIRRNREQPETERQKESTMSARLRMR